MLADPLACVVIQQPGDVVYADCLVYHGVILGFTPGTQDADKWGIMIFHRHIQRAEGRLDENPSRFYVYERPRMA
ncbi:hypothetical protein PC118_g3738 [Phytophthora cactorum]|uniref:Uncharacterized protein n=1 Tax=Phytophthora cactorum TaxID=29920 RepID=A0A8T1GML9_9STRA|nr:hypothetical protein PC111_g24735 [Phytophthora cactorum]KAG2993953.1 hypothetical protein PC118_g3738 [Phytophthora cactorum]KAG4057621.1 hypothetical protein PC123_g7372 [Phytophthora cactorum]